MKVMRLNNPIIKFKLRGDRGEVLCYTLDLDRYELSISGETCGSYKWFETPETESFLELMIRCDKWYLCDKLFDKVFDDIASAKAVIECVKDYYDDIPQEELDEISEQLNDIEANEMSYFVGQAKEILEDAGFELDDYTLYDACEKTYKYWNKKAVEHFCEYIVPELKKIMREEYDGKH